MRLGSDGATADDDRVVVKKFLGALRSALGSAAISTGAGGAAAIATAIDGLLGGTSWTDGAATRTKAK